MLNKFADELKKKREESGLTLQQLATKTRIDLKFLEAIEQGNFAFLPELYVKAFVKQFAKTIGLDENIILKKYEAAKEGKEYDLNPPDTKQEKESSKDIEEKTNEQEAEKSVTPEVEKQKPVVTPVQQIKSYVDETKPKTIEDESKANKQLMIFGLGGVGLIIVFALVYFLFFNQNNKIIVEEIPIDEAIEESNQRYIEERADIQVPDDSASVHISSDSLYLTFYSKDTSWIFVVLDNNRTQEFTLTPNSKMSVAAANNFKAIVGNSGAVTLQLNNKNVDFAGKSGSVKYFKLDKAGLVYLNSPPKIDQE
ncbi:MAG: helix-turn-helix domain-containing protein [Ignavibacteriota bacterium]|nr:helix-turn-helix domain-containing protein [Ignavibacteriota bacterium]MBW7841918.1 helix-turn-helix domain-containing protein [Ignavibacterium sp.]MCO6446304.1 helix-turn-helix domain-containing protein [Ignavibacterium album]MCZ2268281.1 helix-turn-helix domain-containing protein [Ignavibacteriales bacterium]HMN17990.1 helix-turn-helix domain-containing protein [Ignavibacteriaceae bacterium]